MPITKEILQKYVTNCFFETGTFVGDGVQAALDAGFKKVISIELDEKRFATCKKRFENNPNVFLYLGDVELVLNDILDPINETLTFWLDAHYSGAGTGTALGIRSDPIFEELDVIKKHKIKNHIILIDDLRLMDKNKICNKVMEINTNYQISFEEGFKPDDILVAKIA